MALAFWFTAALYSPAVASTSPDSSTGPARALSRIRHLLDDGRFAEAESLARLHHSEQESVHGADSVEVAEALDLLVEARWRAGNADEETLASSRKAVALKERHLPPGDPGIARSLNNLAQALILKAEYGEARALCERALAIAEKALGPEHLDVAESLTPLADLLYWTGDYAGARPLYERALAIREKALGPEDPKVGLSLYDLGGTLWSLGDHGPAKAAIERALAIQEGSLREDHPAVANTLNMLANVIYDLGERAEAKRIYERSLAIRERALGPGNPLLATPLFNLAGTLFVESDYRGARQHYERALGIWEKAYGPEHPWVAECLMGLGRVLRDARDHAEANSALERALAILEKTVGPSHPSVAQGLQDLGILRWAEGDYAEARRLYERALGIQERSSGPESPQVARTRVFLARLLVMMGDLAESGSLLVRSLPTLEKILGPQHDDVAWALQGLGELHAAKGDLLEAARYYERALSTREKISGPDHPWATITLNNLGQVYRDAGEPAKAEAQYRRALRILETKLGPEKEQVGWTLINLANLYRDEGKYSEAIPLFERGVEIRERTLGSGHPWVAWNLIVFAEALTGAGEIERALTLALRAEETGRNHLRLTAGVLPERQALLYSAARHSGLDLALSLSARWPERVPVRGVWDALIRSRSIVLDEMGTRHRSVDGSGDPELGRLHGQLAEARKRLANLAIRGPSRTTLQDYDALIEGARREKERAEQALAEKSLAFREERIRERAGLAEIRSALPPRSALVAFARYLQRDIASWQKATPAYAAFVVPASEGEPKLVQIGMASEIDSLVSRWRKEVSRGGGGHSPKELEADYRAAGEALRRRIWDPLAAHLGQSSRIFVVLDGALHLVNLAALPVDGAGYLVETGPLIHHLSAERDLVRGTKEERRGDGILAVGGPAFDDDTLFTASAGGQAGVKTGEPVQLATLPSYRGRRSACGDFQSMRFEPLPASEREVNEIIALWKSQVGGNPRSGARRGTEGGQKKDAVFRLVGARASESTFKEQAQGRRVVHLATHGFFLGGRCASALDATRAFGGPGAGEYQALPPVVGENPLLLSGLALAGANHRASAGPGDDDGILTAEEVAAMDLSGVEWVVLSACDTGVGEFRAGEGLLGLRRAFQVAGARTVITTLWPVEDEATRAWMRNLYQERLGGASTAEAVRSASRKMIESLKRTGLPAHPYFWAGFMAVGDLN